jgi:DNA-binding MarR family transcriptional regulator
MIGERRTDAGERATGVILATFRANGLLLAAGDRLAEADGLTSARWQVLGALALAGRPLTVPQIARRMGLTRQSVHATIRRLASDGLVELLPNTDHRRSQLVGLTERGVQIADDLDERQITWINELVDGLTPSDLAITARVLDELSTRLEYSAASAARQPQEKNLNG